MFDLINLSYVSLPQIRWLTSLTYILDDTPPRRELKVSDPTVRDKSLFDLQLAPQSVLMFQFLEEELNFDSESNLFSVSMDFAQLRL